MMSSAKRNALLVLGMHRSGTSALTRVLSFLGYALPRNIAGISEGNQTGHWEPTGIAQLNESVFEEMNIAWFSWTPLRLETLGSKRKAQIIGDMADQIRLEYPGESDFVLKDPRVCRLAPLMLSAFEELGVSTKIVIPLRNPLEVANSLHKRDGISKAQSAIIWLRYVLDAEFSTRGQDRVFTLFDELISKPQTTLNHIIKTLNLDTPIERKDASKEIKRFLNSDLKHHEFSRDDVLLDPVMRGWVSKVFSALILLRNTGNSETAFSDLDEVRQELDNATPLMESILNSMHLETQNSIKSSQEELSSLKEENASKIEQLVTETAKLSEAHEEELSSLKKENASKIEQLVTETAKLSEAHEEELSSLKKENASKIEQLVTETAKLSEAHEEELSSLKKENASKIEQLVTETAKLSEAHEEELSSLKEESASKIEQLEGEVSQLSGTLRHRNDEISKLNQKTESVEAEIKSKAHSIIRLEKKLEVLRQKMRLAEASHDHASSELKKENDELRLEILRRVKEAEQAQLDFSHKMRQKVNALEIETKEKLSKSNAEFDKKINEMEVEHTGSRDALNVEIQHLRHRLSHEQRTVFKPMVRRLRSLMGTTLRTILPNQLVDRLAFIVPTAEQKQILQMREREMNGTNFLTEASRILPKTNLKKPDIFIFAIIGWHFRTQRPQHIARELSELGHRVFYFEMDPPRSETEIERLSEGLWRIKLKLDGAEQIPAYVGNPTAKQQKAWLKAFYDFCENYDTTPHKELIVQHPFWWQLAKLLSPEFRIVYDCMDDVSGFDNSTPELMELEHEFLGGCDALVVSSTTLFEKYKAYKPLDIIRNATELEPFVRPDLSALTEKFKAKTLLKSKKSIIKVGYVGAIADWFDTELLRRVAQARPDIEFHLCGNISAEHPKTLKKEQNVHFYGEIPYKQVPAFHNQMDVLMIPFRIIPIIRACDPVKFYEHCAIGKPTVATRLPELSRASHLAFFADSHEEFAAQIDAACLKCDDVNFIKSLREFASENTWPHRAEQFDTVLNNFPKVSVVILAYGDPDLTNATLHSLKAKGDVYPNMDVLIVDNGSSLQAITKMRDYASGFTNVTFLENGENLGFAGGNNKGIKAATGEFVLLLNNDTYVSPGSILAMIQHLQKNPILGAVGPLTNNIGNEAKLEINYDNMAEMIQMARFLTTGYRGKYFYTRVVAYFAVMFRNQDFDLFGMLSEDYGRGMFEDDDHCHKIQSEGYKCAVAEDAYVHHHLSATFSEIGDDEREALFNRNKGVFERKWGPWQPHTYREGRTPSDLLFSNEDLFK